MDFSVSLMDGMLSVAANPNWKQCRSASEMMDHFDQSSRDQDWRSESIKMARTESYIPNKNCMLQLPNSVTMGSLIRSNSMLSDARLGCSPTNSSVSDGANLLGNEGSAVSEARLMRSDSVASAPAAYLSAQKNLPYYHQAYQYKSAGLPLAMGRDQTMMMSNTGMHAILGTRSPFTATQWQELEQQALIFKYMMAGVQVPPDLVIPIRKNMNIFTSLSPGSLRPNMTWGSFHLGYGSNADPEPGRCRRTDGKKWRCSRDAVPDQKYCERHMNRGRHRSRKPVEGQTQTQPTSQSLGSSSSGAPNSTSSLSLAAARSTNLRSNSINPVPKTHNQNQITSNMGIIKTNFPMSSMSVDATNATATQFQIPLNSTTSGASTMPEKNYRYQLKGGDIEEQIFVSESSSSQSMNSLSMLSAVNNSIAWARSGKIPPIAQPKTGSAISSPSSIMQQTLDSRALLGSGEDFSLMSETSQMNLQLSQVTQHHKNSLFNTTRVTTTFGANETVEDEEQPLRHFFDAWPRSRDRSTDFSSSPNISISSSPRGAGKLSLSPLKLSMPSRSSSGALHHDDDLGIDPTQMGLGVGMGLGLEDRHRPTNSNSASWIPIAWDSPMGGPLAEVLHSTCTTPRECNVNIKTSALNLMTDGWDATSPKQSPPMASSPSGVLQKTFGSLSDSSTGSSPRAVVAKPDSGLCENLRISPSFQS
eukprot:Gb_05477 [translate_table: standard]